MGSYTDGSDAAASQLCLKQIAAKPNNVPPGRAYRISPLCERRICARREWRAGSFVSSCGSSARSPGIADPQQVCSSPAEVRCGRRWPCSREWRKLQEEKNQSVTVEASKQSLSCIQHRVCVCGRGGQQAEQSLALSSAAPPCCSTGHASPQAK